MLGFKYTKKSQMNPSTWGPTSWFSRNPKLGETVGEAHPWKGRRGRMFWARPVGGRLEDALTWGISGISLRCWFGSWIFLQFFFAFFFFRGRHSVLRMVQGRKKCNM